MIHRCHVYALAESRAYINPFTVQQYLLIAMVPEQLQSDYLNSPATVKQLPARSRLRSSLKLLHEDAGTMTRPSCCHTGISHVVPNGRALIIKQMMTDIREWGLGPSNLENLGRVKETGISYCYYRPRWPEKVTTEITILLRRPA